MKKALALIGVLMVGLAWGAPMVTMKSLLQEMVDREGITRLPDPSYTLRLHSSYDRGSYAPDMPSWFANGDASQFVRVEQNEGRRELVMLDAKGPGAVVRWWVTVAGTDGKGIIRVYIDGKLAVEGSVLELVSGGLLCGAPLSDSVSPQTDYLRRGHNLYLPLPYAKSCKLTYESASVWARNNSEAFYYNVEARTYPAGTRVESFSMKNLSRDMVWVSELNRRLASCGRNLVGQQLDVESLDGVIQPGQSISKTISGARALRLLAMTLNNGEQGMWQALRSTVLEISFDGKRTVWAPVGEFFGTGYQISPARTWYTEVFRDGRMEAAWVMPFRKECVVTLRNVGTEPVTVSGSSVMSGKYEWSNRSMYFGAGWRELRKAPTRTEANWHYDVNYVTLTGQGVYVGTGLTLFNTMFVWWGEGDEKIWVDGEAFPSFVGTGSEDFFGYAWSHPNNFSHPFIAQPEGAGANVPGLVINSRYRALDAIPFNKSLQFDMEMWHHDEGTVNYAPISFWYMRPGGVANTGDESEAATFAVARKMADVLGDPAIVKGVLMTRFFEGSATEGRLDVRGVPQSSYKSKQLCWVAPKPSAVATFNFNSPEAGAHRVRGAMVFGPQSGRVTIAINGKALREYDAFEAREGWRMEDLGTADLKQGANTLTYTFNGANEKVPADRVIFGVDYFEFMK